MACAAAEQAIAPFYGPAAMGVMTIGVSASRGVQAALGPSKPEGVADMKPPGVTIANMQAVLDAIVADPGDFVFRAPKTSTATKAAKLQAV